MHPGEGGPGGFDWRRGFWEGDTDEQETEAGNTCVGERGEDV